MHFPFFLRSYSSRRRRGGVSKDGRNSFCCLSDTFHPHLRSSCCSTILLLQPLLLFYYYGGKNRKSIRTLHRLTLHSVSRYKITRRFINRARDLHIFLNLFPLFLAYILRTTRHVTRFIPRFIYHPPTPPSAPAAPHARKLSISKRARRVRAFNG